MLSTSGPRIAVPSVESISDSQCLRKGGWSMQGAVCFQKRGGASKGWLARVSARPFAAAPGIFLTSRERRRLSAQVNQRKLGSSEKVTSPLRNPFHSLFPSSNGIVRAAAGAGADAESSGETQLDVEDGKWQRLERRIEKFGEYLSTAFPLWVGLACLGALALPNATLWIDKHIQVVGISLTMLGSFSWIQESVGLEGDFTSNLEWYLLGNFFGMGMTLTLQDFQAAFALPKELLAGVVLQYTVMPSAGYAVSRILQLPPHYAAGLILVACCPGGTASNIVTYLARGNVALSVLMTAASTFLAVAMTPILTAKLVGQYIAVDASALFYSTVQVVLLPVLGGAIMNNFFHRYVKKVALVAPTIAVFIVAILVAGAVGRNAQAILASGGQVVLAVMALHTAGFAGGYVLSRVLRIDESSCRTISIEVGMQNSVLGVVLAAQHFSNPLTVVPCAVSSVCHSLIGSTLAGIWRLSVIKGNVTQHGEPPVEVI